MRVGRIGGDDPVLLACELGSVIVVLELCDLLSFHLYVLVSLLLRHAHAAVVHNFVELVDWRLLIEQLNSLFVFLGGQLGLIDPF